MRTQTKSSNWTTKENLTYRLLCRNIGLFVWFHYIIYLFTAIGLSPGGSGYSTSKQNMKLVITRFKSGELHEKHVVATWNLGNHLLQRFSLELT